MKISGVILFIVFAFLFFKGVNALMHSMSEDYKKEKACLFQPATTPDESLQKYNDCYNSR